MDAPEIPAELRACVQHAARCGFTVLGWRSVPVEREGLGKSALETEPIIEQWFVTRSTKWEIEETEAQVCLYLWPHQLVVPLA